MDTFCGSLCGCGVGVDKTVKTMTNREILISANRYAAPEHEIDDDDDDDVDSEDEASSTTRARRTSSYSERQRQPLE
jgi:hypothetical protein